MGINLQAAAILESAIDFKGLSIVDFGDQMIVDPSGNYPARDWYLSRGAHRYVSLDINGERGAINRDIRGDLSDLGQCDVVTNFGTIEHVGDGVDGQIRAFANMHRLCVTGGYVVHDIPLVQFYRGHSPVLYSPKFLHRLYKANDYECVRPISITNGCHTGIFLKRSCRDFAFPESAIEELCLFPGEGIVGAHVCN